MMLPPVTMLVRFLVLVGLYVAGAWLATHLLHGPDQVTLVWLPAGLSLAALIVFGRRYWPFIPLAECVVQLMPPAAEPAFIAFTATANTLGALAGAQLIRTFHRRDDNVLVVRSFYLLLVAGLVLAVVSAAVGVTGLVTVGYTPLDNAGAAAVKWIVANFFGVLLLAPASLMLTLTVARKERRGSESSPGSLREQACWLAAMLVTTLILLNADRATSDYVLGLSSLPLALLIWSALRFSLLVTTLASLAVGLGLTLLAGLGLAGFRLPESMADALILLTFLSVIVIVPLVLSGAANENRIATRRLLRRARTDDLTGLLNRTGFEELVRQRMARSNGLPMHLLYLDLDSFKLVNDSAGHAAGDRLVQGLAGVLRSGLSQGDLLARLGGDEFALFLPGRDRQAVDQLTEDLRNAVASYRLAIGEHVFACTASLGVVDCRDLDYSEALAQVDAASFTAKELGGNRVQWGGGEAAAVVERTTAMRWAARITEGIEKDRFLIYCQSIAPLSATSESGCRFEVLIRLRDPGSEHLLMPGQFVPAAERFRLGPALDRHVIDRSLRWLEARPDWLALTRSCSINLCAASVEDAGFVAFLAARLAGSSVPAGKLCFEITETSAVRDLGEAQRFIVGTRALGCRLALDDFGTGFCSFAYLNALDVDYFKIDGSFVRDIEKSTLSLSIVRAIADIARGIDKKTIAEFVENDAIRLRLVELGVDYAQGYGIDKPRPIEDYFAAQLRAALPLPAGA